MTSMKALLGHEKPIYNYYSASKHKDQSIDEILPTEANPQRIDVKMNPTRLAGKGWEDIYKLSILIKQ